VGNRNIVQFLKRDAPKAIANIIDAFENVLHLEIFANFFRIEIELPLLGFAGEMAPIGSCRRKCNALSSHDVFEIS
jgi:hypothetical protein